MSVVRAPEQQKGRLSRARALSRAALVLSALFRVVLAVTALQLSGLPHFAADMIAVAEGGIELGAVGHGADCDERSCPPGCPTCHHAHSSVLPALGTFLPLAILAPCESTLLSFEAGRAPRTRFIPPPDRPPRLFA